MLREMELRDPEKLYKKCREKGRKENVEKCEGDDLVKGAGGRVRKKRALM